MESLVTSPISVGTATILVQGQIIEAKDVVGAVGVVKGLSVEVEVIIIITTIKIKPRLLITPE